MYSLAVLPDPRPDSTAGLTSVPGRSVRVGRMDTANGVIRGTT